MKIHGWMVLALVGAAVVGCGGNGSSKPAAQGENPASVTSVKATGTGQSPADTEVDVEEPPLDASASPAEVVSFFLDALRAGNKAHVAAILTKKARQETAKADLVVQPIGTPDAKYEVGTVEFVGSRKDGAHVQSMWTEVDAMGASISYDVIWVLRRQETGWRVAGMATQMGAGETPEFLNFENPQEMLNKIQQSAEESAAAEEEPVRQATRPK